jgi:hypothetical protein
MNKCWILAISLVLAFTTTACNSASKDLQAEKTPMAKENTQSKADNNDKKEDSAQINRETNNHPKKDEKNSESNDTNSRKSVSGQEVTGTFQLKFKNDGLEATNEIKILALGGGNLKVSFNLSYPFRINNERSTVNVGQAQGEADIEADTAVYSTKADNGKCEIKIKFVKPSVIKVSQKQEGNGCGFGLNVSAQGTYKKVSDDKPEFSKKNLR